MKENSQTEKTGLFHRHAELWKFIKFEFAGFISTAIELVIYYLLQNIVFQSLNTEPFKFLIFQYEGIGYMWSFLISTTIGYAIAFLINRNVTFHADINPAKSAFYYLLMVLFTIFVTTWLGTAIINVCIHHNMKSFGEAFAKPFVAVFATVWTYPTNRFIVHRHKKIEEGTD